MTSITLSELDNLLAQNPEYWAAERELRPDLNLANDIIMLRVEVGWSQAELAAQVGTDQANISRLESSMANPTLKFLKKVARALDAVLDVRLRRHDDIPGTDTLENFIREPMFAAQTNTAQTNTAQQKAIMNWQTHSVTQADWVVSANHSGFC